MATQQGAQATFFADQVGTLEPGKRADIVVIGLDNITQPYLHPDTNIVDALLYRGRGLDVDTVIVDGEVLLRGRRFTKVDKADVWAQVRDSMANGLDESHKARRRMAEELFPYTERFYQGWSLPQGEPHYRYNSKE